MTNRLVLSEDERASGVLRLHSDVYPHPAGWRWTADHPSGWTAEGTAATPLAAQEAAEAAAVRALAEEGDELAVDGSVRITRLVP